MTNTRIGRRVAVMIVAVPCALVEEQLEAAVSILVVVLDELLLRESVDDHEQHKLRRRFAAGSVSILSETAARYEACSAQRNGKKQPSKRLHDFLPVRLIVAILLLTQSRFSY